MATNTFSPKVMRVFAVNRPATTHTFRLSAIPNNGLVQQATERRFAYGTLAITGWIRDASAVPLRRVVQLMVYPGMQLVARAVSDPNNALNNYFFNELQPCDISERYVLVVFNEDGTTAARVKDARIPV